MRFGRWPKERSVEGAQTEAFEELVPREDQISSKSRGCAQAEEDAFIIL